MSSIWELLANNWGYITSISIFGKPGKEAIWKMISNDLAGVMISEYKHDFEVVSVKDEIAR